MVLLYADLDIKDSNQIIAKLDTANVPYKLRANGTQIFVPSDKALRMRMTLAQEGMSLVVRTRTTRAGPNGMGPQFQTGNVLLPGRQHWMATFDGRQARVYINGKPVGAPVTVGGNFSD